MFSRKTVSNLMLLGVSVAVSQISFANSFTAKRSAQGFTGVTGDYTSALDNPAVLVRTEDDKGFYLSTNLGLLLSDPDDLIDRGEDLADALQQLEQDINDNTATQEQIDAILGELEDLDLRLATGREGINLLTVVPGKRISWGMFANQYGKGGATIDYDPLDSERIQEAFDNGSLDLDELESQGIALGFSVIDAGVMAAVPVLHHVNFDLAIGASIKYQRLDLFDYRVKVFEFDEDDFDASAFSEDQSSINADLGMLLSWGESRQWHAGLVVRDLANKSLTSVEGLNFDIDTSATVGIGYDDDLFSVAVDIDVIERSGFDVLKDVQYASVGAEFDFWQHAQLRTGFRTDMNDVEQDVYTIGLGLSPWNTVALDLAYFHGSEDTKGAALQLAVKF